MRERGLSGTPLHPELRTARAVRGTGPRDLRGPLAPPPGRPHEVVRTFHPELNPLQVLELLHLDAELYASTGSA